jgi:hypothetical protein
MIMEITNDGKKIPITIKTFWIVIVLASVISFVLSIAYGFTFCKFSLQKALEYAPNIFQSVFTIFLGALGISIYRIQGLGKGTKYYSSKYGKKKLLNIMQPILNSITNQCEYCKIVEHIEEMQNTRTDNGDKSSEYEKACFHLQDCDLNFCKLWNDFNYFHGTTDKKYKDYEFELKKCIFIKIYRYDERRRQNKEGQ